MKKTFKRVLCVFLVSGLMMGSMASCGNNNNNANANAGGNTNTEQTPNDTGASADGASADTGFHAEGFPIVDEMVTLSVLHARWGNMGDTFTQNQWLKDLETSTNVKIDWQVVSTNDWGEQKAIMLASGTLPDMLLGGETINDGDIMNNLQYFLALNSYIDMYMPHLSAAMEETPDMRSICTFPDGNIYSMPAKEAFAAVSVAQPVINQTWLDRLGLEVPDTVDDLYEVLKAFKEQDANGNGNANDEIPYTSKGLDINFLMPFGITRGSANNVTLIDGAPVYYPAHDRYKEGIQYMHRLYAEGLIDQEIFTQDDTMTSAKYQNPDAALVGFSYQWTPDAVFGKWGSEYMAFKPIAGFDGARYQQGDLTAAGITRNQLVITTFCKTPEVAARWADEFYTDEATIQNQWGAIGTVIQKNDDGTYELMDPPEGTSADAWYWDQALKSFGPKYASPHLADKLTLSEDSGDGLKAKIAELGRPYVVDTYPRVINTMEELEELPTLTTDIESYVTATSARWITEGGIEEEWDAYVQKLNEMGLERLMEIHTSALNRYNEAE